MWWSFTAFSWQTLTNRLGGWRKIVVFDWLSSSDGCILFSLILLQEHFSLAHKIGNGGFILKIHHPVNVFRPRYARGLWKRNTDHLKDRQVVASGRKLNLQRDLRPKGGQTNSQVQASTSKSPKKHFKADYPVFQRLIIDKWTSLN